MAFTDDNRAIGVHDDADPGDIDSEKCATVFPGKDTTKMRLASEIAYQPSI